MNLGVLYTGRCGRQSIRLLRQRKASPAHLGVGLATGREDIYV